MGSYVTISTKVRRELELIVQKLSELGDVLNAIDIQRVVKHVREDRERC